MLLTKLPFICTGLSRLLLCSFSHFILTRTHEAGVITPVFQVGQWLIKEKWNAQGHSYPRDINPHLIASKWGGFLPSCTVWAGFTALRSFLPCDSWDSCCLCTVRCWSLRAVMVLLEGPFRAGMWSTFL